MIDFNKAIELANNYFLKEEGLPVTKVLEADTHWIFYAVPEGEVVIGGAGVKIDKQTGTLEDFILPDDENFELLDRAQEVELNGQKPRKFFVVQ